MSQYTYVSLPTEIEAIQWTGRNKIQLMSWAPCTVHDGEPPILLLEAGLNGQSGVVTVGIGSWVARNVGDATDYWPIHNDHFQAKYSKKPWSHDE